MKLYLVQHGEASPKEIDPDRSLTQQGRKDIERLAEFLGRAGIGVERVIHSGKLRASQTAELLAAVVAPSVGLETNDHIRPNDDPRSIDWVKETGGRDSMIVGHMPFMGRLVSLLLADSPESPFAAYQPGTVVCLESGTEGGWQINWMIRPELL